MSEIAPLFCANHPKRETLIRCSKCEAPICQDCRVETPVGMRCRQCGIYTPPQYQVAWYRFAPAGVAGALAGLLGGMIGSHLGYFSIFVGPVIGSLVAEAIGRAAGNKRGTKLAYLAAGTIVFGAFIGPALGAGSFFEFLSRATNPWIWLYVLIAAPAAFWRLR